MSVYIAVTSNLVFMILSCTLKILSGSDSGLYDIIFIKITVMILMSLSL